MGVGGEFASPLSGLALEAKLLGFVSLGFFGFCRLCLCVVVRLASFVLLFCSLPSRGVALSAWLLSLVLVAFSVWASIGFGGDAAFAFQIISWLVASVGVVLAAMVSVEKDAQAAGPSHKQPVTEPVTEV